MSVSPAILSKENKDIPDAYGMRITFLTGSARDWEGSHRVYREDGMFEIITSENRVVAIPLNAIACIEYDDRFTKMIEIKRKLEKEK